MRSWRETRPSTTSSSRSTATAPMKSGEPWTSPLWVSGSNDDSNDYLLCPGFRVHSFSAWKMANSSNSKEEKGTRWRLLIRTRCLDEDMLTNSQELAKMITAQLLSAVISAVQIPGWNTQQLKIRIMFFGLFTLKCCLSHKMSSVLFTPVRTLQKAPKQYCL